MGIVGVIVYDRIDIISHWLLAWSKSDKIGMPLIVIHNCDGKPKSVDKEIILQYNPDYYIVRPNIGQDIGAFRYLIESLFKWEIIFWFTDDVLPMRPTFLREMHEQICKDKVGLVGHYWVVDRMRTVAFAMKREVATSLIFPATPLVSRVHCINFEFTLAEQVRKMGWIVEGIRGIEPYAYNYEQFCNDLYRTWMWDCHRDVNLNLWNDFYTQFGKPTFPAIKLL